MSLVAEHLQKRFKKRTVVNDVSIAVNKGEIVGLLGPNGAGKSTTFYMIVGLIKPDNGSVSLWDKDISKTPMHKRCLSGIGYLPQEASVFRKMTVYDNIMAALEIKGVERMERKERVEELIEQFRLNHVTRSYGYALSGGERRRAEIARCLAGRPDFILLDEPFAGIDPISVADIQNMVFSLKDMGIGVLITDHNVRDTLKITDRAYIISDGTVLTHGTPAEVVTHEAAIEKYLGKEFSLH
ncbi:MAG: LPS export ABC transporter ATP-binding protein [Deferribacteraceae bacterium]|jgi:lipopolysaccharide export system ATP-binding protein|nr:LPS export ABC transporter ATP-binding protein [Deferribacteraceae bacterium]